MARIPTRVRPWAALIPLLVALLGPRAVDAATTGNNGTHDPSRIIESNGRFYFCSTGGGCASSSDGLAWTTTGLRLTVPSWSTTYAPGGNQGIWAPDIIFYNGKYYIYYAVAGLPAAQAPCFIGLYTTPTLDATAASYKLTDEGVVVDNPMNTSAIQFSTIDPAPIIDPMGNLWTAWGSGYGKDATKLQIWATRLGTDGLPLTSDASYQPPAQLGYGLETGRIEASYLYLHDGTYYLFWDSGSCCDGASSTYAISVARAASLTGPYSGARSFYASNGSIHGPGHVGIYDACGATRFTYHYYPDTGGSVLGENELTWGSDGWPVAGAPSTAPLHACGQLGSSGPGGAGGGGSTGTGGVIGTGGASGSGGAAGGGGGTGTGGAKGTGGASATGGAKGTGGGGGSAGGGGGGTGGASGTGGVTTGGTGGATATGGTTGVTGGNSGTGGSGAAGGSGQPDAGAPDDAGGGCACAVQRPRARDAGVGLLWMLGLVLSIRRRAWRR